MTFRGIHELVEWAEARWPDVEWHMKPASLVPDLIEAESGYEYEVETDAPSGP